MRLPDWVKSERSLVYTGLLGLALSVICLVMAVVGGGEVEPHGDLWKAVSFDAALGVFLISTAAILPAAGMKKGSSAFFRWSYIALGLYCYFAETVQNMRGVDPRFTESALAFDQAVANIFTTVAMLLIVFYLFFMVQFYRRKVFKSNPELVLGIRYAIAAVMVSFAVGISISVNGGRYIGGEGNLIWLHGMGFHALQALPIIAWLTTRGGGALRERKRIIHFSGAAFLCGLLIMGWQTFEGRPLLEWSGYSAATAAFFLLVAASAVKAWMGRGARKAGHPVSLSSE